MNGGYLHSFVADNRGTQNGNRDSGFRDDDDENDIVEEQTPVNNNNNINSFGVSTVTDTYNNSPKNTSFLTLNESLCIINILASTLGVGSLVFPNILYQIGIITSLIIFIFVSISVYFTLDLLRRFVADSNSKSFSLITQQTLGKFWLKIYTISAFIFYMSCIINYLDTLYEFINSLTSNYFLNGWQKIVYFVCICFIEVILCVFTNKISTLHYLSLIVVFSFLIFIIFLISQTIISIKNNEFKSFSLFTLENGNNNKWQSFLFIMAKIIEFFYGYIYHSFIPTLLSGLPAINNVTTKKVHNVSFSILVIIYILISVFGCSFYDKDSYFILDNNSKLDNSGLVVILRCILILIFITLIPIRYIIIRDNYTILIGQELSLLFEILITSICLIINNVIVGVAGNSKEFISQLIHYFGGALGVFICFILPVIMFISINGKTQFKAILGYIITFVFVLIGFFSIFYNFQEDGDGIMN
jgi:amino acid permease